MEVEEEVSEELVVEEFVVDVTGATVLEIDSVVFLDWFNAT